MPGAANALRGSPLCTDACRLRRRFSTSAAAVACRPPASSPPPGTPGNLPPGSFDAIICLYVLIHLPLPEQPRLIGRIAAWLRPGGWLLATVGDSAWTGTGENWLGGPAPMWWSRADASTYRSWLREAGLPVTAEEFVPEGTSGHALFWARRPPA
ncbi:Methyltransferase domain-containing protein [Micromonospora carbonacea]|uniref:Methyltransferase domain-containing protein n=1 Tax=Micromonospora carbonacea TaxID=47853 RepID=A0A1C4UDH2_9ACTN|nr:Methyltransferase domain-containing protein [Micromonospora carbonacea]